MAAEGLKLSIRQQHPFAWSADLSCTPNQLLALVGPSGSGKSTLLRAISGLNHSVEGRIHCAGTAWQDSKQHLFLPPQQRRLGMVFQHYALFPHLNVLENVMEGACPLAKQHRRSAAMDWLDRVHMAGMDTRYPDQLSGGQQQRVALARALVGEPRLLLLDEPFAAVDRVTREKLYRELAAMRSSLDIPTLLVTHDVEEALMLADQLCIFSQGEILQTASPAELIAQPASGQVARLTGHRNIFRAQVLEHREQEGRTLIEWRGQQLYCRLNTRFVPGQQISWVIPRSNLLLYTPARSREPRENTVKGTVRDIVALGDMVLVTLSVMADHLPPLHLNLPAHVVERRQITLAKELYLTLQADGIWLMDKDKHGHAEKPLANTTCQPR